MNANPPPAPPPAKATPKRRAAPSYGIWRTLQTVFSVGLVIATLLTFWTPANLFSNNLLNKMLISAQNAAITPQATQQTATPSPKPRIGIVAGHWGNDPGSVCQDGVTEEEVNLRIANIVRDLLKADGFEVELLKEFDPRLTQYKARALVSIHNDSCDYINDEATGFKVAPSASNSYPEKATRLTACLTQRYERATGLKFHYNSVTRDMTEYHAFREINSDTTAAIIETGFLNLDRHVLLDQTDRVAQGVADGIICFMRNEDIPPTPVSSNP
jgi:N-acetylmuramoyl-L-alanine amidase